MKKRLLAAIMSLCMIVSLMPVSALAYGEELRNTTPYFFLLKPGDYTIESNNGSDYYYLLRGGTVSEKAEEEGVDIHGEVIKGDISSYMDQWPTSTVNLPGQSEFQQTSSDPVDSGSITFDENGNVTGFTIRIGDEIYTQATYSIRWEKLSYATTIKNPPTGDTSSARYHIDGVLYKNTTVAGVLDEDVQITKTVTDNKFPYNDGGDAKRTNEEFDIVLEKTGDTNFQPITIGHVEFSDEEKDYVFVREAISQDDQYLTPGEYVVKEQLTDEQAKMWEGPEPEEGYGFTLYSNGNIKFNNDNKTFAFTNTAKTFSLTYDDGVTSGSEVKNMPTSEEDEYTYNQKTEVSSQTPTRDGYEFLGWDSDKDSDVDYKAGADIQITEDVKLVAVWKELEALSIKKSVALVDPETNQATAIQDNQPVYVGDILQYTVTVTNSGAEAQYVIVYDTKFPMDTTGKGVTVNPSDNITWSYGSATISEMGKDQTVTFTYYDTVDAEDELVGYVENTADVYLGQQVSDYRKDTASTKVTVAKTYTLTYDANGGTFYPIEDPDKQDTYSIERAAGTYTLEEELPDTIGPMYDQTTDKVSFAGWTTEPPKESEEGKVYSYKDTNIPKIEETVTIENQDVTVYAVWGYDEDQDGVADINEVIITPADITIYTGGDSYQGDIVDDSGKEVAGSQSNGFPEPGFYITLPTALNDQLRENQDDTKLPVNLSDMLSFVYEKETNRNKGWTLKMYNPASDANNIAYSKYIYQLVPAENQEPVRLLIKDAADNERPSDQFDFDVNTLYQKYTMTIYGGGNVDTGKVQAVIGTENYPVFVGTGDLTVRGVKDKDSTSAVETEKPVELNKITAVANSSVTYYINDSAIPVRDNADIHLLADGLAAIPDALENAAKDAISEEIGEAIENPEYNFMYLDLVDASNGNAYVTLNKNNEKDAVTIHWPIPTDADTSKPIYVVHFDELDRDYTITDGNIPIKEEKIVVYHSGAENQKLTVDANAGSVSFETSTFSPFALVYEKDTSTPPTITTHTITATAGTGGSISPNGAVTVNDGANRTFTITPASGYAIADVKVDGASVGAVSSYTFPNVTKDHTISASFYWVGTGGGSGSGGGSDDSDPTGNLSISLDVNGGDDDFTFTVILTDKNGDDLENNFYFNGDFTGTIGSGDEITLENGETIVIRNLPEGTRYEVIIETADGYTYVIDGEEGVIHTGMNEAEFTATRTVPVADPSVTGVSRWLNTTDHIAYLTGYPGGAFGPDNNMTRAEVAQMFYALLNNKNVTITKTFPDVPADAWYATAVNTLASLGMVSGDENGNYRPNDPITRAEFCVIALAFAYEPENAVCYFGDVSRSDWFYTYVAQAASYGWIGGYTNGNFGPNDRITRAQVTTIVNNMLGRAADRDYVIDHQADLVQFTDLTRAHWGYFQIMEATNAHDYTKSNGTENWR